MDSAKFASFENSINWFKALSLSLLLARRALATSGILSFGKFSNKLWYKGSFWAAISHISYSNKFLNLGNFAYTASAIDKIRSLSGQFDDSQTSCVTIESGTDSEDFTKCNTSFNSFLRTIEDNGLKLKL